MKTYSILPEMNEHINNAILIKEHPVFEGVCYRYGDVSIDGPEEEEGDAIVNFNYEVAENPNDVDTTSLEFKNFIGEILVDIITENMKELEKDGDGSNNIIESSEQ